MKFHWHPKKFIIYCVVTKTWKKVRIFQSPVRSYGKIHLSNILCIHVVPGQNIDRDRKRLFLSLMMDDKNIFNVLQFDIAKIFRVSTYVLSICVCVIWFIKNLNTLLIHVLLVAFFIVNLQVLYGLYLVSKFHTWAELDPHSI